MNYPLTVLIVILTINSIVGQSNNPNYDANLAEKLGADDYGMKKFVFVILKTGKNKSTDQAIKDSCFAAHLKNIKRLVKEKMMVASGPIDKNDNSYRGIFVLKVNTFDEAMGILMTDAAIKAEYLEPELYFWSSSAALPEYRDIADKIWKIGLY